MADMHGAKSVKIKICGITREYETEYLNEFLPDYAGFVFACGRHMISRREAVRLSLLLDNRIKKVGVFVNAPIDTLPDTCRLAGIDVIQLHGDETPEFIIELAFRLNYGTKDIEIWKAIRIADKNSVLEERLGYYENIRSYIDRYRLADRIVFDTYAADGYGGSGRAFDWTVLRSAGLAIEASDIKRIVLAGGLNAENVLEAIGRVHPAVVDVSSGVETEGVKDREKVREFIYKVRDMVGRREA